MTIKIPHHPPRDPLAFKGMIDFWKGYRGYIVYGSFFFIMAFFISLSCFYPPYNRDTILFKMGLGIVVGLGVVFGGFRYVIRKHKERIQAFTHGKIVTGFVTAQGTTFALLKNAKEYTLSIAIPNGDDFPYIIEARNTKKTFHVEHPIESEISVLFDKKTKSVFIPAEVDVEIE